MKLFPKILLGVVALVILAFPTAIVVNILRVVTLGILSLFSTNFTGGEFHSFIGLVWLVPAFLIYLGLMWIIGKMMIDVPTGGSPPSRSVNSTASPQVRRK